MNKDIWKTQLKWTVVKTRNRIGRGQGWLYYIKDIAYVFITIYFIEDILRRWGINDPEIFRIMYIIFPILYFISCYIIGFLDEKYGIWKLESIWGSRDLNPFMKEIDEKIDLLLSRK